MRVCLVTPAWTEQAEALLNLLAIDAEYSVTVLITGVLSEEADSQMRSLPIWERAHRWRLDELPAPAIPLSQYEVFIQENYAVYQFIRQGMFDAVHFEDRRANGFFPIQAKRTGVDFLNTRFFVSLRGPSLWEREHRQRWSENPVSDARLDFMERYCFEFADVVISHTHALLEWTAQAGWRRAKETLVFPPLPPVTLSADLAPHFHPAPLAYVGDLEGDACSLFCDAIDNLIAEGGHHLPAQIRFLATNGRESKEGLEARLSSWPDWLRRATQVFSGADASEIQHRIDQHAGVFVVPSTREDLPEPFIRILGKNRPLLSAMPGGISEYAAAAGQFRPDPISLAQKLRGLPDEVQFWFPHRFDPVTAREKWRRLFRETRIPRLTAEPSPRPRVSVCIPHYNHGSFLPTALLSITRSQYDNQEVIVVDDGSTCEASLRVFQEMRERYEPLGWRFLQKANEGLGATRNFLVRAAQGELIYFLDSDNVLFPEAISTMVRALNFSGADCVTSHNIGFLGSREPAPWFSPDYYYCPIGGCLEAGMVENVFGDGGFCARRDFLLETGGFTEDRDGYEDWEFLAKIVIAGKQLEVVPVPLIYYRYTDTGLARGTNAFLNQRRVIRAYDAAIPKPFHRYFSEVPAALYFNGLRQRGEQREWLPSPSHSLEAGGAPNWLKEQRSFQFYERVARIVSTRPKLRAIASWLVVMCERLLNRISPIDAGRSRV